MHTPQTIFISGSGRSGTNITKAIFSQHPDCVALPFEYRFTVDPGGIVDFIGGYSSSWSPFMADQKLRALEDFLLSLAERNAEHWQSSQWLRKVDPASHTSSPEPYAGWELERWMPGYKKAVRQLLDTLVDYKYQALWPGTPAHVANPQMYYGSPKNRKELIEIFSTFLATCFDGALSSHDGSVFVEDNTWSILFARDLLDLVPTGRLLHIVRDPRDVIASLLHQRWTPSDLDQMILWYGDVMQTWERQKALLRPEEYMEIKMEDIVRDTKTTIQSACTFVGLSVTDAMTSIDLSQANIGRYKDQFNNSEITKIETALSDMMDRYGY